MPLDTNIFGLHFCCHHILTARLLHVTQPLGAFAPLFVQ